MKKILLVVLAVVVGFPVVLVSILLVYFHSLDRTNGTFVSSGEKRDYLLYVPPSYDPSKPTPLVISMHAAAMWPAAQMETSRWNRVADEEGFLVVYPSGTGLIPFVVRSPRIPTRIWRVDSEAGLSADVTFLSELMDRLAASYDIDPTRIYVNGFSNGGAMAFVLSCRLSHRIAAVGMVAGAQVLPLSWCTDSRPVPMIAFHGTADRIVPYEGGLEAASPTPFPNVRTWAADWARRNRCVENATESSVAADVTRLEYANCANDAGVVLYSIQGGGHSWPGGKPLPQWMAGSTTRSIDASSEMWAFFRQHPLVRD